MKNTNARPNTETPTVERRDRYINIHNHRQDEFASFPHNPEPIVTAEMLWSHLQECIRNTKYNNAQSLTRAFQRASSKHLDQSLQHPRIEFIRDYEVFWQKGNFMPLKDLNRKNMRGLPIDWLNTDNYYLSVRDKNFHERARWQRTPDAGDITEDWEVLQQTIEPSLLDEDCLGGLGDWMANTPKGTQYILFGDTNHNHRAIRKWRSSGDFLSLLIQHDIHDLVVEAPIEFKDVVYNYLNGDISELVMSDQLYEWSELAQLVRAAKTHNITVHCLDRQLINRPDLNSSRFYYERIELEDELLAKRIQDAVQGRKTAIVYGEAHFAYDLSLHERLGKDKCRHINLHADLTNYKDDKISANTKHVAPYAYLIDEGQVVATRGRYRRNIPASRDPINQSIMMGKQEKEIEKYLERVQREYDGIKQYELKGVVPTSVLHDVYWYQEALKCGFTDITPQISHLAPQLLSHPALHA